MVPVECIYALWECARGHTMDEVIRELLEILRGYMEDMATLRTRMNETIRRIAELVADEGK